MSGGTRNTASRQFKRELMLVPVTHAVLSVVIGVLRESITMALQCLSTKVRNARGTDTTEAEQFIAYFTTTNHNLF